MDFFQELKELTKALDARAVDYALCGGVALAIHGVPRATQDIDLLVRPEDLARLRETARACGFVLESIPMDFASGITIQRFTKLVDGQPLMLDALLVGGPLESGVGRSTERRNRRWARARGVARRPHRAQTRRGASARLGGRAAAD